MSISGGRLRIAPATSEDRERIYRMRHETYARELGQHPANAEGRLQDALDAHNVYFVAIQNGEMAGFVSVTPPSAPRYSVEKYFERATLPFPFDDRLYEIRLLTVVAPHRGTEVGFALMYAAFRWIEGHGGTRVVAIGRREVLSIYLKVGLESLGRTAQAGAVTYELLSQTVVGIRHYLCRLDRMMSRVQAGTDWEVGVPFWNSGASFHGGAFFEAVGVEFDRLEERDEVINADVLDAWFPPSPLALAALTDHLPWLARTSPPIGGEGMVAAIARARGLDQACVLPGAGSSDLVFLAFRQWMTPASRALILDPTYSEYPHVLENVVGCRVDRLPLQPGDDYRLAPAALDARLQAETYDPVALVNPNNPTGQALRRDELEPILRRAPATTRFWIDEAYLEYFDATQTLEPLAARHPNVVVCKSMSKVYGLSGLRAAYLCACPATVDELRRLTPPWAVGLLAQVAAVKALQDPAYYDRCYRQTAEWRAEMTADLSAIDGMTVIPGVANFLLCRLPEGRRASGVLQQCRMHGLFLRGMGTMGTRLDPRLVRITVKDAATNRRMLKILRAVLGQGPAAAAGVDRASLVTADRMENS